MRKLMIGPAVVMMCMIGATGPGYAATVNGFVTGALLNAWCTSEEALSRESCLSYLRGVFDSLQAMADKEGGSDICISTLVPITQIKIVAVRYARHHPQELELQGGVFVIKALEGAFPCAS